MLGDDQHLGIGNQSRKPETPRRVGSVGGCLHQLYLYALLDLRREAGEKTTAGGSIVVVIREVLPEAALLSPFGIFRDACCG